MTYYSREIQSLSGKFNVTFLVNASREKLTRSFDSQYQARVFINKLRHSKRCTLISYPIFNT